MKRHLALLFVVHASACLAQTTSVLRDKNSRLIESLKVPSGKTLTIESGGSIINLGTATGFGSGGGGSGLDNIASTITGATLTLAGTLTTGRTLTVRDLAGTIALTSDLSAYLTTSSASSTYEPILTAGTTGQYYRGDKTWQTLNATAVGLGNVSNALQLVAANNLSDLTNAGTARTNLGLGTLATQNGTISDYLTTAAAAGTYQPLDTDLTSIAALTTTTHGRSLLTGADAAATRSTLGLGTLATQSATISDYLTTAAAYTTYAPIEGPTFRGHIYLLPTDMNPGQVSIMPAQGPGSGASIYLGHSDGFSGASLYHPGGNTGTNDIAFPIFDPNDASKVMALTTNADGSIANNSVTNAMLAGSIAASKLVGTDITTVGTITSGTWNGTTIAVARGGTGATTAAGARTALLPSMTGNSGKYLRVNTGETDYELATVSGGGGGGNWVLISTTTISGSPSTLTFTFSGSYRKYRLELENVYCSSDGFILRMRTSTDGGSTFDSGASNYGYAYGASGTYGPVSTTGTYIETSSNMVGSATDEGLWGEIDFYDPLNASLKTFARWQIFGRIYNSAAANVITGAGYRDSAADVDTVQLYFSSGNFAGGKIRLFGWSE